MHHFAFLEVSFDFTQGKLNGLKIDKTVTIIQIYSYECYLEGSRGIGKPNAMTGSFSATSIYFTNKYEKYINKIFKKFD